MTDPGAAPAELETQVTRIVENSVATVGDVVHITSNVRTASRATTVEFVFGKNIDRAVNDVRDAVTRVRSELPGSINEPVITRSTTSGGPMLTYTVRRPRRALPSFPGSSTTKSPRRCSPCRASARSSASAAWTARS